MHSAVTDSRHQIIGIVSGHEIATSVVAREGDPRSITVAAAEVLPSLMRETGASCAPVLSEQGEILGVLSMEDLLA